jgi:hypothetical protein
MGRPLDEPTESGKPRETDEKRLARIPTTKESWNAQQKKFPDSDGNLPEAFSQKKRKTTNKKYNTEIIKKEPEPSKKNIPKVLFFFPFLGFKSRPGGGHLKPITQIIGSAYNTTNKQSFNIGT